MAHTPILPKRIDWLDMIDNRIWYDWYNTTNSDNVFINQIIHWDLTESVTRSIVFSDFYKRFYNKETNIPLFFTADSSDSSYNNSQKTYISNYEENYHKTKRLLEYLWINSTLYTTFSNETVNSLYFSDKNLNNTHRIGLRSDVVYYNINKGKIVPDHRILVNVVDNLSYTIRFFLNSTKETILWDINHPLYLFGCVAVLVNPNDKRYKKIRGKEIILPITNKQVPIIPNDSVNIEWHGTRILVPTHNREDFQIALELWLPIDVYAFDKYGIFTDEAKIFAGKSLDLFSDNVVKYIDDISNLDQTSNKKIKEYRDKNDGSLLFPILEKNIYIWLWDRYIDDNTFISDYKEYWLVENLKNDIEKDEYFCISNQDTFQPIMTSLWWYFNSNDWFSNNNSQFSNLLQDIIYDLYVFRLLELPAKWDDIIDVLCSSFWWKLLWKIFYDYRTLDNQKYYDSKDDIHNILSNINNSDTINVDSIDLLLSYIDHNGIYIHTKNWYTINEKYSYHYDNEYIWLSFLLSKVKQVEHFSFFYNKDEYKSIKYFIYLYSYLYKKPLSIDLFALSSWTFLWSQRDGIEKTSSPDAVRLFLLQTVLINDSDDVVLKYTFDQCERFIQKRWNLSRIIPLYKSSIWWIKEKIIQKKDDLSDYDVYLITKIHELYDEVLFLQSKNHTWQLIHLTISTLWNELSDMLLYILKKNASSVTELVSVYVILFANHILYPIIPTTVLWFLNKSWYELDKNFFIKENTLFLEKNYKCNLMMHIISQWYQKLEKSDNISWFVLQANRDFLEYFKNSYDKFIDFIWLDYNIRYIEENEEWPDNISSNKIFTMQRWVIEKTKEIIPSTLPSLSILQWQLQYKQQLLQTLKNTIVRLRATWQTDKLQQFQTQIDSLIQDITDLEYQISKLKYF